ncbi:hypothetical protein GOBAR_DD03093 [Gossypium barbadense]|nr:hypothetical protein GOBAR_DD03093 [Gossypium barbadense]
MRDSTAGLTVRAYGGGRGMCGGDACAEAQHARESLGFDCGVAGC